MGASKIGINVSVEKPVPLEENADEFPLSGSSYTDEQLIMKTIVRKVKSDDR